MKNKIQKKILKTVKTCNCTAAIGTVKLLTKGAQNRMDVNYFLMIVLEKWSEYQQANKGCVYANGNRIKQKNKTKKSMKFC